RTPGVASTCASAEGTALINDPCHGPAVPRSARASTFGTTSRQPPAASVPKISNTDTSKLSDVDASTRDNSAPNTSAAQQASDTAPACSTMIPLGRPVDPDVKITYATSRGPAVPGRFSPSNGASSAAVAGSSSGTSGSPSGSPAATAAVVSTATGADSASMYAIRSAGYAGSTGT